ncbi:hypothetical protein [Alkalihalobacillus pseudalcaliphilus]|uniref:hypothetical protein n=1 Tax=Alkalihalobacillus pseudalcaliphilus TaxID=79884 RepID=UPI00064D83D3|nr:hypothetical protein [Alkalihalobacillus pseudalcaliphilus]KMK76347.1 hypothetical protein AB990_14195 [Alkalihalobacillus pseudalcaliphilus]
MWKQLYWLLLISFLISCNQAGSLPNSANWELEGYILSVNEDSVMLSDFKNGLVSVSQFDEHVEVGDRVAVKIDALMESYPYQAFSKGVKIIEPKRLTDATISEQEAVQIAYEYALSLGVENRDMVDYITIRKEASYHEDKQRWQVSLDTHETGEFVVKVDAIDGNAFVDEEEIATQVSIKNVTNTGSNLYKDQLQDAASVSDLKVMIDSAERLDGIINYSPELLIKMKKPNGESNTYHLNIGESGDEGLVVDLANDDSAYILDEQATNALRELLIKNED